MAVGCRTNLAPHLVEWWGISCTWDRRCFDRGSLRFGNALGASPGLHLLWRMWNVACWTCVEALPARSRPWMVTCLCWSYPVVVPRRWPSLRWKLLNRLVKILSTSSWICLCWGSGALGWPQSWPIGLGCSSTCSARLCHGCGACCSFLAGDGIIRRLLVELEPDWVIASLLPSCCLLRYEVDDAPYGPSK